MWGRILTTQAPNEQPPSDLRQRRCSGRKTAPKMTGVDMRVEIADRSWSSILLCYNSALFTAAVMWFYRCRHLGFSVMCAVLAQG
jgi:hypothetical protein